MNFEFKVNYENENTEDTLILIPAYNEEKILCL